MVPSCSVHNLCSRLPTKTESASSLLWVCTNNLTVASLLDSHIFLPFDHLSFLFFLLSLHYFPFLSSSGVSGKKQLLRILQFASVSRCCVSSLLAHFFGIWFASCNEFLHFCNLNFIEAVINSQWRIAFPWQSGTNSLHPLLLVLMKLPCTFLNWFLNSDNFSPPFISKPWMLILVGKQVLNSIQGTHNLNIWESNIMAVM